MTKSARSWSVRAGNGWHDFARRWRKGARSGSAGVEFAFIAPVFFVLLMGTMEVGIMYFSQFVLQNATTDAARLIRTGQVASGNMSQSQFRTQICNEIGPLLSCNANLQIDVEILYELLVGGDRQPALGEQYAQSCTEQLCDRRRLQRRRRAHLLHMVGRHASIDAVHRQYGQRQSPVDRDSRVSQRAILDGAVGMLTNLHRMWRSKDGLAAVEFALLAPVMLLMFFGTVELSAALDCRARVNNVASTAADLVAQETSVSSSDMANVFAALNSIIYPYSTTPAKIVISSLTYNTSTTGKVAWSDAQNATARTVGSST